MRLSSAAPRIASATVGLREDTVALQVDDLLGLRDREGNRIFFALMGIGPNEAVRFHAFRGVLFDDSGGLVEAVRSVRRRPDAVALVFNGWRGRSIGLASFATGEAAPCRFEFREHESCGLQSRHLPSHPLQITQNKAIPLVLRPPDGS